MLFEKCKRLLLFHIFHFFQAKFNITVPLPHDKDRHLLSSSSASLHDNSLSEYSSHTHSGDSSVNDSGVVGDHDQDSLYDLTVNNIDGNIINCKEKLDRKPSKIDIPFVVSIGISIKALLKLNIERKEKVETRTYLSS